MDQWQQWFHNQPPATQTWLKSQPVWHDRDLAVVIAIALFMGFFLGYIAK